MMAKQRNYLELSQELSSDRNFTYLKRIYKAEIGKNELHIFVFSNFQTRRRRKKTNNLHFVENKLKSKVFTVGRIY